MSSENAAFGSFRQRLHGEQLANAKFADLNITWNFHALMVWEWDKVLAWLRKQQLLVIPQNLLCTDCNTYCKEGDHKDKIDKKVLRCKQRNHQISIRKFSFFENSKFSIQDIFQFIICFLQKHTLSQISLICGMNYTRTAVAWASTCRQICMEFVYKTLFQSDLNSTHLQLSGHVEIDESMFGRKTKHHRGDGSKGLKVSNINLI